MSRPRSRRASVGNRPDFDETFLPLEIVPLKAAPAPAVIVQNLGASMIASFQEDIRCASHIGKNIYTGDQQGTILKWDPQDGSRAPFLSGLAAPVNAVVGVNESKDLWIGLANGTITVLTLETQSIKNQMIHAHDAAVNCIAAGNQCTWSGGDDFLIKKWDLDGVELFAYNHHHGFIKELLILRTERPENHVRLWGASSDASISVAALPDNRAQHTLLTDMKVLTGHSKGVTALCLVNVDTIWSGCEDGSIGVWSSLGMLRKMLQQVHKGPVGSLLLMGDHVWSGSGDRSVLVWDSSSCQLLFSLGDQGGFVKTMVRVEYMCWVFASGKNVKVWCARSVWDTYEGQKDRLNRSLQKAKESLDKSQKEKQTLQSEGQKFQQDLFVANELLKEQRSSAASALEKLNAEIEKLKNENSRVVKDLSTTEGSKCALGTELNLLREKVVKLQKKKDATEKKAKDAVQSLEKTLKGMGDGKATLEAELTTLKASLEKSNSQLQTALKELELKGKKEEDLVARSKLHTQKAEGLQKSVQEANLKVQNLKDEVSRSIKDQEVALKRENATREAYERQRAELEEKIKQLQNDLTKANDDTTASIKAKDNEIETLHGDLNKKTKELKKAMKEASEDKKSKAKELKQLNETITQLKKIEEASSSSQAEDGQKLASLASELDNTRNDLEKALREKSESQAEGDKKMQQMTEESKKTIEGLEQTFKESLVESDTRIKKINEENKKTVDDLEQAMKKLQADCEALQGLKQKSNEAENQALKQAQDAFDNNMTITKTRLQDALKERDEARIDAATVKSKMQDMEENMKKSQDLSASLNKEKDEMKKDLNEALSRIENLNNQLLPFLSSESGQMSKSGDQRNGDAKSPQDLEGSNSKQEDATIAKEEYMEKLQNLSDLLETSSKEKSWLKDLLTQANAQLEKLKSERSQQDGQLMKELDGLKTSTVKLQEQLSQKAAEIDKLGQNLSQANFTKTELEKLLDQMRRQQEELQEKLPQEGSELDGKAIRPEISQVDIPLQEVEELRTQKHQLENLNLALNSKIEELEKDMQLREEPGAKATDFDKLVKEMEKLLGEIRLKEDKLRDSRITTPDAGGEIETEELRDKVSRLEAQLEDTLNRTDAATSVNDSRMREFEDALLQAHMDYRLLSTEFQHMQKKRRHHRDSSRKARPGVRSSHNEDDMNLAFKMMRPGFFMDYTRLKVSSDKDQEKATKNIEVIAPRNSPGEDWNPVPAFERRGNNRPAIAIPVTPPPPIFSSDYSPVAEPLAPVERPTTVEKERYFPSHGPLRVRRGLSP